MWPENIPRFPASLGRFLCLIPHLSRFDFHQNRRRRIRGNPLASFDRKCAPPQAPAPDITKYDQLSCGQLHEPRKNEVSIRRIPGRCCGLDWRPWMQRIKRILRGHRTIWIHQSQFWASWPELWETMGIGTAAYGNPGKRPHSVAREIALAVDLEVVKEHAQWRNPELRSQVAANQSSVLGGVGAHQSSVIGAVSEWVAGECGRVLGR